MNYKKIVKANLKVDKLIFQKNGNIKVKEFYFYTHGRTPEKLANSIQTLMRNKNIEIEIVETRDYRNNWPKDSWLEVIFKIAKYLLIS